MSRVSGVGSAWGFISLGVPFSLHGSVLPTGSSANVTRGVFICSPAPLPSLEFVGVEVELKHPQDGKFQKFVDVNTRNRDKDQIFLSYRLEMPLNIT